MNLGSVLILGGSGFFGRAFAKRLLADNLSDRICIYSRGEYAQHQMRQQLNDDERMRWFIGDVRDLERLKSAMHNVDVVIHAAALKRIEVCHYNVMEAVATNVIGTTNAVKAGIAAHVGKFILLSTDKACEPISTYGYTKALAERVVLDAQHYANAGGPKFACTRYGNVWGSTGSVGPIWKAMIKAGETELPISDPDVTRFFMWECEAVDLVLNLAATMQGGEVKVPTLPAYRLGDLAEAMGATSTRLTGLGRFEKMHESMTPGETSETAQRMKIDALRQACLGLDAA